MNFSILKQWHTMNGEYHSATTDYSTYDRAFGEFHAMVKPMQNDENVRDFTFTLIDDFGTSKGVIRWARVIETETE